MRGWYRRRSSEAGSGTKRKLLVHVGANKTGSSAIQRFLALNAPALLAEGIVVPGSEFEAKDKTQGQQVFAFQKLLADSEGGGKRFRGLLDALERAYPDATATLLSAENLTAAPEAPDLFRGLSERYDLRIMMYIRRQDDLILSSWQQWYSKVSTDFWAWATSVIGEIGDWQAHLQNWERVVPRGNIEVRVYERPKLEDNDVIADFHGLLETSRPFGDFVYPRRTANPSFSDAVVDLVKGNGLIFKDAHDNDFYKFVSEMTGNHYTKSSRQSAITFPQRQAINERYREKNEWVRKNYFPHLDGPLFTEPKESDYDYVSRDRLEQQKLEFLTAMMYQMYKRTVR